MKKNNDQNLQYFFDRDADVLYFTKRKPSPRDISEEVGEGIVVRFDQRSREVVGFTILNFLKKQQPRHRSFVLPLTVNFSVVK